MTVAALPSCNSSCIVVLGHVLRWRDGNNSSPSPPLYHHNDWRATTRSLNSPPTLPLLSFHSLAQPPTPGALTPSSPLNPQYCAALVSRGNKSHMLSRVPTAGVRPKVRRLAHSCRCPRVNGMDEGSTGYWVC